MEFQCISSKNAGIHPLKNYVHETILVMWNDKKIINGVGNIEYESKENKYNFMSTYLAILKQKGGYVDKKYIFGVVFLDNQFHNVRYRLKIITLDAESMNSN